jgi:YbbR domain-containing protein
MKKLMKKIKLFFHGIWVFLDKKIIIPLTKLVIGLTSKFDKSGKHVENFLSNKNTLLFMSLFLSLLIFIVVDQKIITFTDSSAEVLKSQTVTAIYNEEAYIIEGLPEAVDITLIGSKADLYFAKQSPSHDITVDLSDLKPGTHRVNIRYNQAIPSIDYKVNPSVATVIIYPKISESRTLTTDILNQDSLDAKLVIENIAVGTDKVIIKGAEYKLKQVATVKALIDIKNLTRQEIGVNVLNDIPLRAYDDRGNVVDVELVPNKISADITIASPSKDLPIRVIPKGSLGFGKAISSIATNVTSVTVYGSEEALANLTSLPVEVSVEGLKANQQFKIEIPKPVGVKSLSVNNITITIALEDSIDRELSGVSIEWRNLNEELYRAQGASQDDIQVSVILKGVESVVSAIEAGDVIAYVDLKGLGEGTHEVDVQVEGSDLKVQYLPKTLKVKLVITRK